MTSVAEDEGAGGGAGRRLFDETGDTKSVRLVATRTVDDLAYLTYEVVRAASGR